MFSQSHHITRKSGSWSSK